MKKVVFLALAATLAAYSSSCPASTIHLLLTNTYEQNQALIDGSAPGDRIVFPVGTLSYGSALGIICEGARVYTGSGPFPALNRYPTPPQYSESIVATTSTGYNNSLWIEPGATGATPGSACTIENLYIKNQGIFIWAGSSGILFQHIQFDNLPWKNGYNAGFYFHGDGDQGISNTTIQYSVFGNTATHANCGGISGGMGDTSNTAWCNFIVFNGSADTITIAHNRIVYGEEGIHVQGTTGGSSDWFHNVVITQNSFEGVHGIAIETQAGDVKNYKIEGNVIFNFVYPMNFTFGISNACCTTAGQVPSTPPAPITSDNVILLNTPLVYAGNRYGYAIENAGTSPEAKNNLIQAQSTAIGVSISGSIWNSKPFTTDPIITGNIIEGSFVNGNYIQCGQGGNYLAQSCTGVSGKYSTTGNTESPTISPVPTAPPTISPADGAYSTFPSVTITSPKYTHSFYTIDGSTPVPGEGTTREYTGSFKCTETCTVRAVAMWGSDQQPLVYPAGWGYVPSYAISATYTTEPQ